MEQWIHALKNVMLAEKESYRGLLELAEKKKDILIINDVAGLNRIVRQETETLQAIKPLASEREAILKKIAENNGMPDELNIDTVIAYATGRMKEDHRTLKGEFNRILRKLSDYNELNNKLIDTQRQYTAFCVEMLTKKRNIGRYVQQHGECGGRQCEQIWFNRPDRLRMM